MSLDVPVALLERAERGAVTEEEFVACVRDSLPYAWQVVSTVSTELAAKAGEFAEHAVPPPSEAERGQLLRALASDAIRGGLERHFGVRLAFRIATGWPRSRWARRGRRRTGSSSPRQGRCATSHPSCATAEPARAGPTHGPARPRSG